MDLVESGAARLAGESVALLVRATMAYSIA